VRVSAGGQPSGVVTFLFTDIEGSTRRWEADADGMQKALAAHDEVLRSAIEAHGGWLLKHIIHSGNRERDWRVPGE
jgi:class 3 adenylate cyclase